MKKALYILALSLIGLYSCSKSDDVPSSIEFVKKEMIGAYLGGKTIITVFVSEIVGENTLFIEYSKNKDLSESSIHSMALSSFGGSFLESSYIYTLTLDLEPETVYYYRYLSKSSINNHVEQTLREIRTAANKPSKFLTFSLDDSLSSYTQISYDAPSGTHYIPFLYYSYNKIDWAIWEEGVSLNIDQLRPEVYICGGNRMGFSDKEFEFLSIQTGNVLCSGDVMSLLDMNNDVHEIPCDYCFHSLFKGAFLSSAPNLPATVLKDYCYYSMFEGCRFLSECPELPALELTRGCYSRMFNNCDSITEAPLLPAKELKDYCYSGMFEFCNNLSHVKCLASSMNAVRCTEEWLLGVAEKGVFEKEASATWTVGDNGIPKDWEIKSASTGN